MIVTTAQLILIQFIFGLVSLSSSPVDPSVSEKSWLLIAFITLLFNLRNQCSFNKLTERHYEKSPWPDAEYVASIVDGGKLHSFNGQIW